MTTDMSCNLFAATGTNARRRIDRLARRLRGLAAQEAGLDSLSVQEVHSFPLLWYLCLAVHDILPFYTFEPGLMGPAGGLCTFSRAPINHIGYISFGPATKALGPTTVYTSLAFGAVHKGILVTESGGVTRINFHASPNHFADWEGRYRAKAVQAAQLRVLRQTIQGLGRAPRLGVYGDSNILTPGPVSREFLADTDLLDGFPAHGPTFSGRGHVACLDWMLFGGEMGHPKVTGARVLWAGERRSVRYIRRAFPSDHSPLIATAVWE